MQRARTIPLAIAVACLLAVPAVAQSQTSECSGVNPQALFPGTPICKTITVTDTGTVSDVSVFVDISSQFQGELTIDLISASGTPVNLFNNGFGCFFPGASINGTYSSIDPARLPPGCPPSLGNVVEPNESLAILDGEVATGDWMLCVEDISIFDGETFNEWCLNYTSSGSSVPGTSNATILITALLLLITSGWLVTRMRG